MFVWNIAPFSFIQEQLSLGERRFLHLAVANAGRADPNAFASALDDRVNSLQIQIPTTLCHIVGMADPMPKLRPSAADFTSFCHINTPPRQRRRGGTSNLAHIDD